MGTVRVDAVELVVGVVVVVVGVVVVVKGCLVVTGGGIGGCWGTRGYGGR